MRHVHRLERHENARRRRQVQHRPPRNSVRTAPGGSGSRRRTVTPVAVTTSTAHVGAHIGGTIGSDTSVKVTGRRATARDAQRLFEARGEQAMALHAKVGSLRAQLPRLPTPDVSRQLADLLDNPLVRQDDRLRLRVLFVKGETDEGYGGPRKLDSRVG